MQPLPTFLILGAQKCGTTALHALLSQHHEICMSAPKETNFFNLHFDKGVSYYRRTFFSSWKGQNAAGEATPTYLFLPYIPRRVRKTLPEVKMLVILRDPVQRAFSHWWMNTTHGRETSNFRDAIRNSLKFSDEDIANAKMCGWFYLQIGYYAEQLKRYFRAFPRERFHIIFDRQLKENAEATLMEIHRFIGVSPQSPPGTPLRRHEALGPFGAKLKGMLRRVSLDRFIPPEMGSAARRFFMAFGDHPPTIDTEMREWLSEHYRPHNQALQELLNADVSPWKV